MRAIWIMATLAVPGAAAANPQLAASGRYVCADGSLASIALLASGPQLDWRGATVRLAAAPALWGFRFRGDGLSLSGSGRVGYRTLKIDARGAPALSCLSVPPAATPGIATGQVVSRQRAVLPAGSTLTVELRDVARADAPAPLLARTVVKMRGNQMPLWWRLDFPEAKLGPPAQPALSARITDKAGKLIWISDTFTPLPVSASSAHAEAEIFVVPVRAVPSPSSK
jgi:uncharacterized lipoprotein YbaY